jgi:two-component system CheB/CheR fusion protein
MRTADRPEKVRATRPRPERPAAATTQTASTIPAASSSTEFRIVALGASAGGLDAFRKLFDALPPNIGMAFVLIQHLDPSHASMMVDLLSGHTTKKVQQAEDGMPLEPAHVYVIPPGVYLSISGGALRLSEPSERHGARLPFDFFLRSLAAEYGASAICVILSGTGADGSLGLRAIKERGGLVVVQSPQEATYDGMPRSAIATGLADFVVPVAKIPEILINHGGRVREAGSHQLPPKTRTPRVG